MARILEAGHYYLAKGPTQWSLMGWKLMHGLRRNGDASLLFVDDIHSAAEAPKPERELPAITFAPIADFRIQESWLVDESWRALDRLKRLSRTKRARWSRGAWYCSGARLTTVSGAPTCVLYDLGLTIYKLNQGFRSGINILPEFWEPQQRRVVRLITKAVPEFSLEVVLYDLNSRFWNLDDGQEQ